MVLLIASIRSWITAALLVLVDTLLTSWRPKSAEHKRFPAASRQKEPQKWLILAWRSIRICYFYSVWNTLWSNCWFKYEMILTNQQHMLRLHSSSLFNTSVSMIMPMFWQAHLPRELWSKTEGGRNVCSSQKETRVSHHELSQWVDLTSQFRFSWQILLHSNSVWLVKMGSQRSHNLFCNYDIFKPILASK